MRKLIVSEFLSLDGVMEAPEKWHFPYVNEDMMADISEGLFKSDTLLFGRKTYQEMAAAWPTSTNPLADKFNSITKFVVSTTLEEAQWNNTTVIKANIVEEVIKLKQLPGQVIMVIGSCDLVDTLMQHDLIDEYWLMIHPLVLGNGKLLFREGMATNLKLAASKTFKTGVVSLTYQSEKKD
ncbi:dihydrofolate reductase family protein [Cohnella silvisoli]|uniref:Dihydrofolate reductase family protein n=1 Tax=Cohnella silvisoli TaxID=2873699 RepID=A0ABV1L242_9BACL|nr:dihydrofolate reductase family protein [Cohnella silvisoli]MCD9025729.1 dihydrofolate reductase family protein [Cohnella silvisoli]